MISVKEKYEENTPLEERIKSFNEKYPSETEKIDGKELFSWHHILTGSCLLGRKNFCNENNLNVDEKYTVSQFIKITENAYGGDIIKTLKESRRH